MMRAPFQILAIPYRVVDGHPLYCVFRRSDSHDWQFIAGGGEDDETPLQAAAREIAEEGGAADDIIQLQSVCSIPVEHFPKRQLYHWPEGLYVLPEYAFGFECQGEIRLSHEHTEYRWLPYEEARAKLKWDSNRTALYELHHRLKDQKTPGGNACIS